MSKFIAGKLYICIDSLFSVPIERGGPVDEDDLFFFIKEEEFPQEDQSSDRIKYILLSNNKIVTLFFGKNSNISKYFKQLD